MREKKNFRSFVDAKYHLAGVKEEELEPLQWNRDLAKEDELYRLIIRSQPYTLVHEDYGIKTDAPESSVPVRRITGFNIFDWYKVIKNSEGVYAIDSAIANFIIRTDQKHKLVSVVPGRNGVKEQMAKYEVSV
jgi:hypothetical protein